MIDDHIEFIQPPADNLFWRYMDLSKFFPLVHTSKLYFARADRIEDAFESALPDLEAKKIHDYFHLPEVQNDDRVKRAEEFKSMYGTMRTKLYLSCLHMSDKESAAMWRLS